MEKRSYEVELKLNTAYVPEAQDQAQSFRNAEDGLEVTPSANEGSRSLTA